MMSFSALSTISFTLLMVPITPAKRPIHITIGTINQLYAVDGTNGNVNWTFGGCNWFWSAPVVKDGVVYAGCLDSKIYAIDAGTGEELWQFTADDQIVATPVLVDNLLVVASKSGTVYMLNADSGKPEHDPVPELWNTIILEPVLNSL